MLTKMIKTSALIGVIISLSACAGMSGKFGCNAKGTDSCTPIADVDHGRYRQAEEHQNNLNINPQTGGYNAGTPMPGEPVRKSESIQRIWIAPFQDTQGNYHEPSYVYFVSKQAAWIGVGAKEITNDDGDDE